MVFECFLCSMTFYSKYNLDNHFRTHTGEKPFKCEDCGKRFAQKGTLKRHKLIHTKEKPFACSYCERRFISNSHLDLHFAIYHPTSDTDEYCNARIQEKQKNHKLSEKNEMVALKENDVFRRDSNSNTLKNIQLPRIFEKSSDKKDEPMKNQYCKFCSEVFGSFPKEDFNEDGCYLPC